MAKTKSILIKKEPAAAETKPWGVRISSALHARINKAKEDAAAAGYEFDLGPAVVAHLESLVASAERELKGGEGSGKKKAATAAPAAAA